MMTKREIAADAAPVQAPTAMAANLPDLVEQQPAYNQLITLLRHAPGAWALAVYESGEVRRSLTEALQAELSPLEVAELQLSRERADILQLLPSFAGDEEQAPVICFTSVESAFPDLFGYLDLQRERLAELPYRLVFWVTGYGWRQLAERAPNFYSRLSGVFSFPGQTTVGPEQSETPPMHTLQLDPAPTRSKLRPSISVRDEEDRRRRIALLEQRVNELRAQKRPDWPALAGAWYDLGALYEGAYRWAEAEDAYKEAAQSYAQAGQLAAQAQALHAVAYTQYFSYLAVDRQNQWDRAQTTNEEALTLFRLLDDRLGEANTLKAIGDVHNFRKELDQALASYDQALQLFRAVGDRLGEANTLRAIGHVHNFRKELDQALASYDQALQLFRAVGDRLGEANTLRAIGHVHNFRKELDQALASYDQALQLFRAVGDRLGEANTLRAIGHVHNFRKELDQALASYDQALQLFRAVGDRLGEANTYLAFGRLARSQRNLPEARVRTQQALDFYRSIEDRWDVALALWELGRIERDAGNQTEALVCYGEALTLLEEIGAPAAATVREEMQSLLESIQS